MGQYHWSSFGTLTDVSKNRDEVIIRNSFNEVRIMSIRAYKKNAIEIYEKALNLIGKQVEIRTSQNSKEWSPKKWFSEINKVNQTCSESETIGETEPLPDQLF